MLLFNEQVRRGLASPGGFKYIQCYYSTSVSKCYIINILYLNTSNVIIQLGQRVIELPRKIIFKYIQCYYSTLRQIIFKLQIHYLNTSNVIIQLTISRHSPTFIIPLIPLFSILSSCNYQPLH